MREIAKLDMEQIQNIGFIISYYESDDKFSQKKLVLFSEIA